MAFYNSGERKSRPGVYIQIVNRGSDATMRAAAAPTPPPYEPGATTEQIGDTLYIANNVNVTQNADVLVIE